LCTTPLKVQPPTTSHNGDTRTPHLNTC
jgi:hypothetical protein